jgi:transaldolase
VLYGEELIGPHTVSTMPMRMLDAFRDHGQVRPSLNESPEAAAAAVAELEALGISLEGVTDKLTKRGVELFAEEFDKLLAAIHAAHSPYAAKTRASAGGRT